MMSFSPSIPDFPDTPVEPWSVTEHGQIRRDEYRWMANRDDPRLHPWLNANNRHAQRALQHTAALQKSLLAELQHLTPRKEGQAAWIAGEDWYRTYYPEGRDYPVFARYRRSPSGPCEILIDGNALAQGHAYFKLDGIELNREQSALVFAQDTTGHKLYTLNFVDLHTGALLSDRIVDVEPLTVWATDNQSIYYIRPDPISWRPCQVVRHRLGTDPREDVIVYEEVDPEFRCYLTRTRLWSHILIHSYSSDTEDIHLIDPNDSTALAVAFCPRCRGHEYDIDWTGNRFVIKTNWHAPNFRICEAFPGETDPDTWREIVPSDDRIMIEWVAAFQNHWVLIEFADAFQRVRIVNPVTRATHCVELPDPACHVWLDSNPNPLTSVIRLGFTSLVTPVTYFNYDMEKRCLTPVGGEVVPGYDRSDFVTERIEAPAPDGTLIPITLVCRRDTRARGPAPLFLFGYGAYGTNIPLYFDQARLPLLNRGFIYAMAHVRGGSERGTAWHETGRLLNKPNTISDFIAASEFLIRSGYARADALFAETLSAGGLMLGGALNRRPELFRGVIAREPFVDPLNTMSDPDIPLVLNEYGEWGDPRILSHWETLWAYSPYDNISRQRYPHILATAALNDSQVQYWEPAKWIARLRTQNTADTRLLLLTNLHAGHGGLSGRINRLREQAFLFAFLIDLLPTPCNSAI